MSERMLVILFMAVAMTGSVQQALSEDDNFDENKDLCALITFECGNTAQSIQDKIERLKDAIAKGTAVYTPEELRTLKKKLDDVNKTLDLLGNKPPYVDDRR